MLADNFGKTVDELDPILQNRFEAYGITADDWNVFRKQKPVTHKKAKFADMLQERGEKFHRMVLAETDYAVPSPDARVRAITTAGQGRATVAGQGIRTIMMLKSFPITIALTHLHRAAFQATAGQKLQYLGLMMTTTTVLGALALQAKDIAAGREPRPMDNKEFFAAAIAQGGGIGIFGDYLFSDVNRFGGGPVQTAFGPTGQLAEDVLKLTIGNAQEAIPLILQGQIREAISSEQTNILGESVKFVERYTPDIWQTHLFKNAMFDQIEMLADPDAQRKYNRMMRKRQRDYQQDYWWKPGEPLPEALQ
jgi:hypothetical protein